MTDPMEKAVLYIGVKLIKAVPMTEREAHKVLEREEPKSTLERDGYLVEYEGGYRSWSPMRAFDNSHRQVTITCDHRIILQ